MNPYAPEGYWLKAKLFFNRSLDDPGARSDDERRLWASLALEQLAKWALANTSPILVADPQHDGGVQLLKALGLESGAKHVTVQASTAFKRCAKIFRPFDSNEAQKFANARNEYLHGSEITFLQLPEDIWWEKLWSLVSVLLYSNDKGVSDLVGLYHSGKVETYLELNKKRIEQQVEAAVEGAKRNLMRFQNNVMSAEEERKWQANRVTSGGLFYEAEAKCPACDQYGIAESDDAVDREFIYSDEPGDPPHVEITFSPDFFSCNHCGLALEGFEYIEEAGIDTQFFVESDDWDYLMPEYGND